MKVIHKDGSLERSVLISLITDDAVLSRISPLWKKEGLFSSRFANIIGKWCVDHYSRYGKAPSRNIESVYEEWSERAKDKETVRLVESFLSSLSDEYRTRKKDRNSDYLIDQAGKLFNQVQASQLREHVGRLLESGEVDEAVEKISSFAKIEIGLGSCVDVLQDREAIKGAFDNSTEALISYSGALGQFYGNKGGMPALTRDSLIAFMGPEKRGKTWLLLDMAWTAMLQRRKVAFFEVGDMSQNQIMRRFMTRASNHPVKPCTLKYPTSMTRAPDQKMAEVTHKIKEYKEPLDWPLATKKCEKIMQSEVNSDSSYLRLATHPAGSISVKGIEGTLKAWERQGFNADVVVIDYADILAPMNEREEPRHQHNRTWAALRAMSQSRHCLVVTATQAAASAYRTEIITMSNFSEDKRKLAHASGIIGLNRSSDEKEKGLYRFNWVVLREGEYSDTTCVHVASCLGLARPCIKSTF